MNFAIYRPNPKIYFSEKTFKNRNISQYFRIIENFTKQKD